MKRESRLTTKKSVEEELKELKFKLKALENFVFEHHHNTIDYTLSSWESSKPFVWVNTPKGPKKEPKEE